VWYIPIDRPCLTALLLVDGFIPRNKLQGYNIRRAEWHFLFMAALLLESEFRGYNIWRACRHSELFEARIYRNLSKEYSHLIPILEANPRGKVSLDTSDVVTQRLIPGSRVTYMSMKCHGHDRYGVFGRGIQKGKTCIC